jgi:uncharacterized cupredoxin-like copper-binding protein
MKRPNIHAGLLNRLAVSAAVLGLGGLVGFTIGNNIGHPATNSSQTGTTVHHAAAMANVSMKTKGGCNVPNLPGTVVTVTLDNMMSMSGMNGMKAMSVTVDKPTVPQGPESFRVLNVGSMDHELVVLPLPAGTQPGARVSGSDGKVDESTSVGEVSNNCAADAGEGIHAGSAGWGSLNLPAGTYELVCNIPGHYASGMWATLTVQ